MTQPVLTDAEMRALISGNPFTLGLNIARLKDFIRQIEKAVIAKLHEQQEPVMYARTRDGEIDWDESCVCAHKGALMCGIDTDEDGNYLNGYAEIPLYAHPCVSLVSHKTACVSENEECETQDALRHALNTMLNAAHPAYVQEDFLREKLIKARDVAFKTLETVRLNIKEHHRTAKNHIPDASKMVDEDRSTFLAESRAKIMAAAQRYADNSVGVDRGCGVTDKDVAESYKALELRVSAELAITRENASEEPAGWQLVPKEPTEEMADSAHDCESYFDVRSCYKAMLSAAPKYEVTN